MTEHSEVRIPVQDVKLAVVCKECQTEVVIDPKNAKSGRFSGQHPRVLCPVCEQPFDSAVGIAISQFLQAVETARGIEGTQMLIAVRQTGLDKV